jgi:septum formation protein
MQSKSDKSNGSEQLVSDFILASSSPRRKELLSSLGISFRIVVPGYDEDLTREADPDAHALKNACEKALWVTREALPLLSQQQQVVISADTIGVLDNQILNKPRHAEDSVSMLKSLSGRTHEVKTAIAIYFRDPGQRLWREETEVVTTQVTFRKITTEEINRYIATGEPADKAGSYAIQGLGGAFVEKISGSYTNVVGLPLAELRRRISASIKSA